MSLLMDGSLISVGVDSSSELGSVNRSAVVSIGFLELLHGLLDHFLWCSVFLEGSFELFLADDIISVLVEDGHDLIDLVAGSLVVGVGS